MKDAETLIRVIGGCWSDAYRPDPEVIGRIARTLISSEWVHLDDDDVAQDLREELKVRTAERDEARVQVCAALGDANCARAEVYRLANALCNARGRRRMTSWDDYGLALAETVSCKSKDPSTKCACVLLDEQHRVLSTGYNGFPRGVPDDADKLQDRDTKLAMVIHAEENALLFARQDLRGGTAYVWPMPPCSRCAAKLAQVGIVRVVTRAPTDEQSERWGESFALAQWIYAQAGIEYVENA